jgi:hypothetical protein
MTAPGLLSAPREARAYYLLMLRTSAAERRELLAFMAMRARTLDSVVSR